MDSSFRVEAALRFSRRAEARPNESLLVADCSKARLPCFLKRLERFLHGEQDNGLRGLNCAAGGRGYGDRRGLQVAGILDERISIVVAERVPKALEPSADRFDDLRDCFAAILRLLHQLGPRLGGVAESSQEVGHANRPDANARW